MKSKWVHEIKGFEKVIPFAYKVYEDGKIESYMGQFSDGHTFIRKPVQEPQRILSPFIDRKGYRRIDLSTTNSKQKRVKFHRLVASAFIPNPLNKPQVNHKDGDKENNHATNLEWATNKENHQHKLKMGLNVSLSGDQHYTHVSEKYKSYHHGNKKVEQLDHEGNVIKTFKSIKEAAIFHNLDHSTISHAIRLDLTRAGYKWRKAK